MYSTIVLFLALGYVGVLGQLETTTYVPIRTNFTSTFKVNFEVTSCKIVGETGSTTLSQCATKTTPAACVAENKAVSKLDLYLKDIDYQYPEILFKPAAGNEKKYTLTDGDTSDSNIKVNTGNVGVKDLDVGFIVNEANLFKIDDADAVLITPSADCIITGSVNCVGNTAEANIYFSTKNSKINTLICKGPGSKVFRMILQLTPVGDDNIFKGENVNIGFVASECNVHKVKIDDTKRITAKPYCAVKEVADCFNNKVTSVVTVNTNPINEDLAILLDGSPNNHKVTFKPIECTGFLTSFNAFGLVAAYWIAMMEL